MASWSTSKSICCGQIAFSVFCVSLGGIAGGLSPKLAEAVLLYDQTVTQPLGFAKAVVTSRPNSDVSDNIQEPTETNCLDFEGCLGGSLGYVARMKPGGGFEFIPDGNMQPLVFEFPFPDGAVNELIKNTPGFGTLKIEAARDLGNNFPETESLDVSAEGIPLGTLPSTAFSIAKACPMVGGVFQNVTENANGNPKVKVTDPQCGPNYHTDVTGIAQLDISQDLMKQILASPGPAFPGFALTASAGVARLKVFSVTLTYTVPAPATFLLFATGAACVAAITWRRSRPRQRRAHDSSR